MLIKDESRFSSRDNIFVSDIIDLLEGTLNFDPSETEDAKIETITYENLKAKNSLYFAVPFNTTPNHCFTNAELLKDNCLLLVTQKPVDGVRCLVVKSVRKAVLAVARYYRNTLNTKIVGITGSVGKTTTTAMMAAVLEKRFKTKSSQSKNIPVVICGNIFRLNSDTEFLALEMASSQPEQIRQSGFAAQLDAAVITNIGTSHIDLMKTRENILATKLQMLESARPGAPFFANRDEPLIAAIKSLDGHPVISFGIEAQDADYRAQNIVIENDLITFDVAYSTVRKKVTLHIHGKHNIYNALACYAVGKWAGMKDKDIIQGLSEFRTFDGYRQTVNEVDGVTVISDFFSCDTLSMISSFNALEDRKCSGRKIAVLGHIMRMGDKSREMHRLVAEEYAKHDFDICLCFDDDTRWIAERVNELGKKAVFFGNNKWKLIDYLRRYVRSGDIVLLKSGRKYSHFEDIAETVFGIYATKNKLPEINAEAAIAYDLTAGKTVFGKNIQKKAAPISLTMIMTALVAIENCDISETVTAKQESLRYSGSNYSNIGLKDGEMLTVEDLLYAVMIASAFDAACVLAHHIGTSEDLFIEMMNKTAERLGMDNTHFDNVCGVISENNYTTAEDLMKLCVYAVKNPVFERIVSASSYSCKSCDRKFTNKFRLMNPKSVYYYPHAKGLKASNNNIGKYCSAVYSKKNGKAAIVVILQSRDEPRPKDHDKNTPDLMYSLVDSMKLSELVLGDDTMSVRVLPAPSAFRIAAGDSQATAHFNEVDGAEGYILKYYKASSPNVCIKKRYAKRGGKTILGFKNGVEYLATVQAYNYSADNKEVLGEASEKFPFVTISTALKAQKYVCLNSGEEKQLDWEYKNTKPDALFLSSDEKTATVNAEGKIRGLSTGTAYIKISAAGQTFTTKVYVNRSQPVVKQPAVLTFTGDIMCAVSHQRKSVKYQYDFSDSFDGVRDIFESSDVATGVLETCCYDGAVYEHEQIRLDSGAPNCNSPSSFLNAVANAGIDMLVTASNHCCDTKFAGLASTVSRMKELGITNLGALDDNPVIRDIKGIKVGFIACNSISNGLERMDEKFSDKEIIAFYTRKYVKDMIDSAKKKGAEYIVVYQHWGGMNCHTVYESQIAEARYIADCGADLIVGSHPHMLQELTYVTGENGMRIPCAYSLGNFLTSQAEFPENRESAILRVELSRWEDKIVSDISYIPCLCVDTDAGVEVRPVGAVFGKRSKEALQNIKKIMGDEFPVYSRKPVVALCSSTTLSGIFGASPDLRYVCPENVPSFASVYSDAEKCTAFTDFLDNSSADFAAVELIPDELCSRMDEKTLNECMKQYARILLQRFEPQQIILVRQRFHGIKTELVAKLEDYFITLVNPAVIDLSRHYLTLREDPLAFEYEYYTDSANAALAIINKGRRCVTKPDPQLWLDRVIKYHDRLSQSKYSEKLINDCNAADMLITATNKEFVQKHRSRLIMLKKYDVALSEVPLFFEGDRGAFEIVTAAEIITAVNSGDITKPYSFYRQAFTDGYKICGQITSEIQDEQ